MIPLSLIYHDVNEAYSEIQIIKKHHVVKEDTRNGPALAFTTPVLVTHTMPYRRVLFDPARDANPFFHYMEALWMLSGNKNVDFPANFAKNILNYSDDGKTLHGAYGDRWRHYDAFRNDLDQIERVIEMLTSDKHTRRAVISMWDPLQDLGKETKDLPCNTHLYFRVQDNRLNMTICNRSNDLVWGMLGSNIVHFSILQEYIANDIDVPVGSLFQFTNNLHVYEGWEDKFTYRQDTWYQEHTHYARLPFSSNNFSVTEAADFCTMSSERAMFHCPILMRNAIPMWQAWNEYKAGKHDLAQHIASNIYDEDWRKACIEWIQRRGLGGPKSTKAQRIVGEDDKI